MKKGGVSTDGWWCLGQGPRVGRRCGAVLMSVWPPGRGIGRDWMLRARAHVQSGRSGRQTNSGASGSELLVAGKRVPDRVGEPAGDVDRGDLGAALLAEPALVALIAPGVGAVLARVHAR